MIKCLVKGYGIKIHPTRNPRRVVPLWQFPIISHEEMRNQDHYHVNRSESTRLIKNNFHGPERKKGKR